MALADTVQEQHSPLSCVYRDAIEEVSRRLDQLQRQVLEGLFAEAFTAEQIHFERYVNLRYAGSDTTIMVLQPKDGDFGAAFIKEHEREFSFTLPNREVLVENLRVRGRANAGAGEGLRSKTISQELASLTKRSVDMENGGESLRVYFEEGWVKAPLFSLEDMIPGDVVRGPAMIHDETQMIVIRPSATATILESHIIIDLGEATQAKPFGQGGFVEKTVVEDPVELSIMSNRFMGIAEQMGLTLQRTSVSVNIKERLDFSCALFGPDGGLVANAPHVPVHLGSMEHAVKFQHKLHAKNLRPGDVLVSNV